jgi:hypothetical protein
MPECSQYRGLAKCPPTGLHSEAGEGFLTQRMVFLLLLGGNLCLWAGVVEFLVNFVLVGIGLVFEKGKRVVR